MKKLLLYLFLSVLIPIILYPQNITTKHHAFSGTVMLGVEGGATFGLTDYSDFKPEVLGRGVIEYFFPTSSSGIFGLKGFYSAGYVAGKDDNRNPTEFRATLTRIGGGLTYTFSIQEAVFPYIFAGASYGWINPSDNNKVELPLPPAVRSFKIDGENYHGEIGLRFLLSDAVSMNLNVGVELSPEDNWDAQTPDGGNDLLIHALVGFGYSLFTEVDADGDGIPDAEDQCPETPKGVQVDNFGCPIDSDNDKVPDYKDKCPDTKSGMDVDEYGCVIDTDGDGVPDQFDKCAYTPVGARVNELGCPDSDGDGVFDNEDKCTDTPKGALVDNVGCPKDSDGDGVPDYLDECPNTPSGEQVDDKGCSTKKDTVMVKETVTLSGDTNFEFNKANLLPQAYQILDPLAESMKQNPDTRWKIEGHTDAVGSDSYNTELSRKRAQSVVDYLVNKGIERSRLEVVPLGESQPVATNDTQEGRSMNRRVEIKVIK